MNIIIGYGYYPGTTGTYFQRSAEKMHRCQYVGTPWATRSGYGPAVDLVSLAEELVPKPDLFLYIDSGHTPYFPKGLDRVDFPTACYLIDVIQGPALRIKQAAFFDVVFVAQKSFVSKARAVLGHDRVYWLPLACDPEIHAKLNLPKVYDVGFVGGVGGIYNERRLMLESLAQQYKMNDFRLPHNREEMAQIYSQSRIVFNKSGFRDLNMRVFEATSSGAMLLTDRDVDGQGDVFHDRRHIVTYDSRIELLELAEYYLQHDAEREDIAHAGHELVTTRHTYDARLTEIVDTVLAGQTGLAAPVRRMSSAKVHIAYAELFSMLRMVDGVVDELAALRRMGKGRLLAGKQLLYALLRRAKYG